MSRHEVLKAVVVFLDQFISRGAADDVRDLRARLADDPVTSARLTDGLLNDDVGEREGYDAMRSFLAPEHRREQRNPVTGDDPDLIELLSWTGWEDWADNKTTNDPAQWHDWLDAVRQATAF